MRNGIVRYIAGIALVCLLTVLTLCAGRQLRQTFPLVQQ